MTDDRTWMHRAFPTLPPAEAEAIVDGLGPQDFHALEWMRRAAEALDALPEPTSAPPAGDVIDDDRIARLVFGDEPIPDLATAERVRRELQRTLSMWVRDCANIQSAAVADAIGRRSRQKAAQEKRWLLWQLSGGNLNLEPQDLCASLDARPWLCGEFGLPTTDTIKKVREIWHDMRADAKEGLAPFTLAARDVETLELRVAFEPISDADL